MQLRILDLFAGCGGLSLGLEQAGHTVVAANEIDEWASDTYEANHKCSRLIRDDISNISTAVSTRKRNDSGLI